jgi:lipopolysaccharide biosynthesis protein/GT2 family glycosyltransferase/SAM-dependent methyltransferase
MNYLWDDQLNLFQRLNHGPFAYSDGVEVEDRLYSLVSSATDRGTFSSELAASITDWPTEYHLSRARHCLLRPLAIPPGNKVLELGCGCGAITRYLGEIGADVVAVDGSLARARVAAERCRDLPNVRVFVDDLLCFETDERFDCVLLIGVLEYAAVFSTQENPFAHYLQSVTRFLAPGGRVVVAIENKLGLKYFNGCAEDHVGAPFFGIQDLYGTQTARTFGRVDLKAQLSAAGLPNTSFYYPFPDYKLPSVVLSAEALSDPAFSAIDLLARSHARDYTGSPFRSFDDALAFSVLHDNRLLADLSNSFLVVATVDPAAENTPRELATAFSVYRAPEFCAQTRFVPGTTGIQVLKEPLTSKPIRPVLISNGTTITHRMDASIYRPGRQLLWRLLKARARSGDLNAVVEALRPWMEFLLRHARVPTASLADTSSGSSKLAAYKLPGEFLDCTPFNVLETEAGLIAIDLEWQSDREVSLGWVVSRGVLHALLSGLPSANHLRSNAEVTKSLARQYGMSVSDAEIESWMEQEKRFQSGVSDVPAGPPTIDLTASGLHSWVGEISRLNQAVTDRDRQIASLHQAIAARDEQIIALQQKVGVRDAKIIDLDRSLDSTRQELARLWEQQQAAVAEIGQLQQQLLSTRRQLAMLEGSTSWRATRIFRQALSPYPRLRRNIKRALRLVWWTATFQLPQKLRARRRLLKDRELIAGSPLFDAAWYLAHYPDVAAAAWDPALHYALHGATERRDPGPKFDAGWYLDHNTDVKATGVNPLLHYLQQGSAEGRQIDVVREPASDPANPSLQTTRDYSAWVKLYDTLTADDAAAIRRHIPTLRETPLISVVMPVYDPEPRFLRKAIDSVIAQLYQHWELCIADDASPNPEISAILKEYARDNPRIKVTYRAQRGHISAASNSALELVTGDFVALMDHDDELPPHALYMVAVELNDHPDADIIYSDEDRIDEQGSRHHPHFKTDWNPELFYSYNLVNHLGVYRTSLVREIAGFREGLEGSQDYDLVLRLLPHTTAGRIRHIPYVLYHWRIGSSVRTFATENLSTAVKAAQRALADYFAGRGESAGIANGFLCFNRVIRPLPSPAPLVSLIVPTRDSLPVLRNCVDGLLYKTRYPNLELIIVDNESSEPATLDYLESLRKQERVRVLRIEGEFNHSLLNNRAVAEARGDFVGFINNDIEIIHPDWLEEMISQVAQPGVGAVGAKLYYANNSIQHGGVILGIGGLAGHSHRFFQRSDGGSAYRLQVVQNLSAVTAACMVVPKHVFNQVGGFDEVNLGVSYNDVDLCLRIREVGYSIVWTPYAELYHLEAISRGYDQESRNVTRAGRERAYLRERWGDTLQVDPYYSPNLSLANEQFELAFPPRVVKPWPASAASPSSESADHLLSPPVDASGRGGSRKAVWNGEYIDRSSEYLDSSRLSIKCISFYLPQFHPIPENDLWWGKNFTEWKNVVRGTPQFVSHYQPRLPGDLGFYDLRVPEVMKEQVEIAKQYGIAAFCFHYYWFSGKRLLERPLENFLNDSSLNLGFCVSWANENWTRRWDGRDDDILVSQQYAPEDDQKFIESLLPYFRDPRYLRIADKPLLLAYRLDILPDPAATVIRWREAAKAHGFSDIYVAAVRPWDMSEMPAYGIDAAVEFPPHQTAPVDVTGSYPLLNSAFTGRIYDYGELANRCGRYEWKDITTFKGVMPSWDNTARRGQEATVFHGSNPANYAKWLKDACDLTSRLPDDEKLIFVNAWNEWAEGAYLEPDARYGYAYLHATANVLRTYCRNEAVDSFVANHNARFSRRSNIAVVLHCYHEDLVPELVEQYLRAYSEKVDVFVTLRPDVSVECIKYLEENLSNVMLLPLENRGRDIRPFLLVLRKLKQLGYVLACKLHTKRSPQLEEGDQWRESLVMSLLGGGDAIALAERRFDKQKDLGVLAPAGSLLSLSIEEVNAGNRPWLDKLLSILGRQDLIGSYGTLFPAGSMYWFRVAALAGLDDVVLAEDAFELEAGQLDGTLAHAVERVVTLYASTRGYETEEVDVSCSIS